MADVDLAKLETMVVFLGTNGMAIALHDDIHGIATCGAEPFWCNVWTTGS